MSLTGIVRSELSAVLLCATTGVLQPRIVRWLEFITDTWHVVVPEVDDVTDVFLLASTTGFTGPFWWICLIALVVADVERLWLLFSLCLTAVYLPFLCCYDPVKLDASAAYLFAVLNCRGDAPQNTFRGRLLDSLLWLAVGSRSRCSPFWRKVGMGLDAKVGSLGFGAIDKWVARHPFIFEALVYSSLTSSLTHQHCSDATTGSAHRAEKVSCRSLTKGAR